jgi:uncharacterized protein YndB with AHSA1/START domain
MKMETQDNAIVGEIEINASPEEVFKALSDPKELAAWWGSDEHYRTTDWQIDLRVGGKWSTQTKANDGKVSTVHGVYEIVDFPNRLVYTWNASFVPIDETRLEFRFEKIPAGTRVHLVHSGFAASEPAKPLLTEGWGQILEWLGAHCANGAAVLT